MDDEQFIASVIRAREESVSFFSNAGKRERERWVVNEFLTNLGLRTPRTSIDAGGGLFHSWLGLWEWFFVQQLLPLCSFAHTKARSCGKDGMAARRRDLHSLPMVNERMRNSTVPIRSRMKPSLFIERTSQSLRLCVAVHVVHYRLS